MHGTRWSVMAVFVVFVAVTSIDAIVLYLTRDRHLGFWEDHFDKGVSLYETGSMLASGKPNLMRPPGYPVFVASALAVRDGVMGLLQPLYGGPRPPGLRLISVLAAHALLLGVLGAAIFWFALDRMGAFAAFACAAAVACNPLLLVIAGHISYPLLQILLVTVGSLLLLKQVETAEPGGAGALFGSGVIWGAATLVKSVTLVAPAFILLWAAIHYGVRNAARTTAFFTAGLLLVVAPYTARNYAVSGRFIPVNSQAAFALWATSLERIPSGKDYLDWVSLWPASAMKTFTEVTGAREYSLVVFEDHLFDLTDRFAAMADENVRRDPTVYAYNASHNGVRFVVDPPTSFFFDLYAWPRDARARRGVAELSVALMTLIAAAAVVIGSVRRDPRWTLVLALFAMMAATHALTYLEARYLYVKLPTIAVGFVFACVVASSNGGTGWRRGAVSVATLAAVLSMVGLFAL